MRSQYLVPILALLMSGCATRAPQQVASAAITPQAVAPAMEPAPLSALVSAVNIPHDSFTLDNGLRVLVNTDRKAPVVAVSIWYAVGSKNEPKGKTGFAHLFEHLMFNGSENAPDDYFGPLQQVGATDMNGTTWFDRTNYFQTVPTGALDRALMMESDRMGHLLGAVTQAKLDNQRGVVQNEKRQGDNQPYGIVEYEQLENLYPSGHPYHHSTIGSMADLNGASLADVRSWFKDNYGPNNAILVLSGDIDVATAREKVGRWFGAIPSGPAIKPVAAPVPTLPAPLSKVIKDQVATTRIYRMWAIPGLENPDYLLLQMSGLVLGGLASSRLDDALVRGSQQAVGAAASGDVFAQAGQFVIWADAKPGLDAGVVSAALDAEIAKYLESGPTADELLRATSVYASGLVSGYETTGGFNGKAPALAEGLLYSGNADHYKTELARAAAITPAEVRDVTRRWLSRPVFSLTVEPGKRTEGGELRGGFVTEGAAKVAGPAYYRNPAFDAQGAARAAAKSAGIAIPPPGDVPQLDFPAIERMTLSNGIKVHFARRAAVPTVAVRISFDAGFAADPRDALGTQSLLLRLMGEGTETLDSSAFARARERLGARINGFADADSTSFQMSAMKPNLAPSLALLSDYVRKPALAAAELERVRVQQLAAISGELNDPRAISSRVLVPLLYGAEHPYGMPPSGLGEVSVVKALSKDALLAFHRRWLRPERANLFVTGDTTLEELKPLLEASFGNWSAPAEVPVAKNFAASIPAQTSRIILVNRPGSPQSMIYAGRVLDVRGKDDLTKLETANDVLGGGFLSRLNMNLRETKGWSYGVRSGFSAPQDRAMFTVRAPVQTDRTGDSVAEIRKDIAAFLSGKGVSAEELALSVNGSARELPGQFETSGKVLDGIANIVHYARPDDYYETLAARYLAQTQADVDNTARATKLGDGLVIVIVGDAEKVRPQLAKLGLPVEERAAPGQ